MQVGKQKSYGAPQVLYQKPNGEMADFSRPFGVARKHFYTEKIWRLPDYLGLGVFQRVEFASGLHITMAECRMKSRLVAEVSDAEPCVYLLSCLRGRQENKNKCLKNSFELAGGNSLLLYMPDPLYFREVGPGEVLQNVLIKVPLSSASDLLENRHLEQAIRDDIPFCREQSLAPSMLAPLLQLYSCQFQGIARKIYMEGLMLEFLACWLDGQSKSGSGQSPRLKPDEIDRIWNAKEILLKDMCNPPSLMSLASSVGLTHTRLNLGFKSVFGGTVYEYLRNQRLEKARLLVVEGAKNMTEIAYETGFASGSHFAYAFRKRFGVSPSRY